MKFGSNIPKSPLSQQSGRPNGFVYLIIIALVLSGLYMILNPQGLNSQKPEEVSLNTIQKQYAEEGLKLLEINGNKIIVTTQEDKKQVSYKSANDAWTDLGFFDSANPTEIKTTNEEADKFWIDLISGLLPFLVIVLILVFLFRQAQGGANSALSFGKSRPKMHDRSKMKTTFADVAGAKEVKEELVEIVDFLKNPKKYVKMGAKIPKGVLLVGPPGTGKTLLARAVAGEANVPFFSIAGSEFVEMFVGVGASRVRDLFSKAKKSPAAIIFIDEIDAVGRQRGAGLGGGHDEREQTLNQILTEMDGFENDTNVIVMAATNRPDVLDPALLRPGRFDRRVIVNRPNIEERKEILEVHAKNKPISTDVNFEIIAQHTSGFCGADLENLLNEAAILAAKQNSSLITMAMIEHSIEKVVAGPEKKSKVLSEEEKKIVAYHETGHAIVGHFVPEKEPVHKISIISRGFALGITWYRAEKDTFLTSKLKFESDIASLLGGRAAEELIFGKEKITSGASNDIERASELARQMITEYGMSESLAPINYGEKQGSVFLGRDMMAHKNYSEDIARKIDEEVKKIIQKGYETAMQLLQKHKKELDMISQELLKKENLSREEFMILLGEKPKIESEDKIISLPKKPKTSSKK